MDDVESLSQKRLADMCRRAAEMAREVGADTPEKVRLLFCYVDGCDSTDDFVRAAGLSGYMIEEVIRFMGMEPKSG